MPCMLSFQPLAVENMEKYVRLKFREDETQVLVRDLESLCQAVRHEFGLHCQTFHLFYPDGESHPLTTLEALKNASDPVVRVIVDEPLPKTRSIAPASTNHGTPGEGGKTKERAIVTLKERWKIVEKKNGMQIHGIPTKITSLRDQEFGRLRISEIGESPIPGRYSPGKVLFLIGATGAGKTTLMSAMVNYVLGVKWEDDFRLRLMNTDEREEDPTSSQTDSITAYTIHPLAENENVMQTPSSITLVDTPGFLDTRGLKEDRTLIRHIHRFFTRCVDCLHRIGIVIPATTTRLTASQRFLYDQILSLFGQDVKNRFVLLSTFADHAEPPNLIAVMQSGISYRSSYQFNAGCLYSKSQGKSGMQELLWRMTMDNLQLLLKDLLSSDPIGLELTREVLVNREVLEKAIVRLQREVSLGLHNDVSRTPPLSGMSKLEDLKCRYEAIRQHRKRREAEKASMLQVAHDFKVKQLQVYNLLRRAHQSLQRLDEIALKRDPLTLVNFIDLLLQNEKNEKRPGWEVKVGALRNYRAAAFWMASLKTSGTDVDPFKHELGKLEAAGLKMVSSNDTESISLEFLDTPKGFLQSIRSLLSRK
ncbi:unnamed protein product [Darwinula stevensoni]|uniref:AAA+ ATPase domain-containing protein n=1 Tax=Darwinula stevensoni TaxID=69355 RepID=A0A7R8X3W0_9CRUS|nr:unnamed protein product [Darwinula stevensoni]CAG0884943.1 unnamed protein product [Darwinula stevensoni]